MTLYLTGVLISFILLIAGTYYVLYINKVPFNNPMYPIITLVSLVIALGSILTIIWLIISSIINLKKYGNIIGDMEKFRIQMEEIK